MKILFLYGNNNAEVLFQWLIGKGNIVISKSEKISQEFVKDEEFELIISYTYRYIITKDILEAVHYNAVNLHISYLPWNRGANPNLWSLIDGTPKGVSIHYIDSKIDNGDIICQKLVQIKENDTLKSSYDALNAEIVALFKQIYPLYPYWNEMRKKAVGNGSYHRIKDFLPFNLLIDEDYSIAVSEFCIKAKEIKLNTE